MIFTKRNELATRAGTARVDTRTKRLVARLAPGDVAIIDHEDLDRVAAESLLRAGISAVVTAAASISGRYPNVGPLLLAAGSVPIIDNVGPEVFTRIADGSSVHIDGNKVYVGSEVVAEGIRQTLESLELQYESAKSSLSAELDRFAENTLEYVRRERTLVIEPPNLPELRIDLRKRHVLVVVRGHDYRNDLGHLRSYVREMRPVVIGVDGGADAVIEFGMKPDIILGDFDSISDQALRCGAQLIVHGYTDGGVPGARRLDEFGVDYEVFNVGGTSEDAAMLLAFDKGAELIVAVGAHASMVEFLDKGRAGMASTFLTRLKVGPILVDAKGVSRLYAGRLRKRDFTFFLASAGVAFFALFAVSYPLRSFVSGLWFVLRRGF